MQTMVLYQVKADVQQLKSYSVPIIGGKDCSKVTKTPGHGDTFTIGDSIKVKALHTPCHTQDSICYFMQDGDDKAVFTGDTLFISGRCACTHAHTHRDGMAWFSQLLTGGNPFPLRLWKVF